MNKIIGSFAMGASTVLVVQKVLQNKKRKENEKLNPKKLEAFLDPFFGAVEDSLEFQNLFEQIVTTKMALKDVEVLKQWFEVRKKAISFGDTRMAYRHLIRLIDRHLPVQGSLIQQTMYDQTIASENYADL
ncbi:hypothetical protein [Enterococcus raffinosus]|uniref:hypothetical protein n=1 Tax=Enterococcus raffinosus TaxID=71452 RepID=UPI003AD380A3